MKRFILISVIITSILASAFIIVVPDEGMFPLSEISTLDLNGAGLKIDVKEVYNPDDTSLVDALVKIGGCTGSFVSPEGLIITNHHCSFGAVQRVSTTERNYLESGFLAKTMEDEIPAEDFSCRITVSYEDVSKEVLDAANNAENISERTDAIRKIVRGIIKREEEKDSTIKAEVSEMFVGQSYVLFRYKTINDVRLVYVPPRSVGEFGGESDNWVWPRHTGDFSFLRAYVAPNGTPADYSEENVPFVPKKYLEINQHGVSEGDFVFLLGYPGRTYKHQPSHFLKFQYEYQLPYISELYKWMINLYEEKSKGNPEFALRVSSKIKSLGNVEKNYRGKIQGIKRLNLLEKKTEQEKQLKEFINSEEELGKKYGSIFNDIDVVYNEIFSEGRLSLVLSRLVRYNTLYKLTNLLLDYHDEITKPEEEQSSLFKPGKKNELVKRINKYFNEYDRELDISIFNKIIGDAYQFDESKPFDVFTNIESLEYLNEIIEDIYSRTGLLNPDYYKEIIFGPSEDLNGLNDPAVTFLKDFWILGNELDEHRELRKGKLNIILAKFMEVKKFFLNKNFIPDANRTLRLTYGYVKGYEPADAVYYSPISTLKGVIEKGRKDGDYKLLPEIYQLYNNNFDKFIDDKLGDVPVAILYNTDTSGGNSGSPILDANGKLVGVNFDRSFEATVNDYVWSPEYSRSIGVDIRYVLWITQNLGKAENVLKELHVN